MTTHRIRQGLDIPLAGSPADVIADAPSPRTLALRVADVIGMKFKVTANEGDRVRQGQNLCHPRQYPDIAFCSPAAGTVREIRRGDRRALQEIVIDPDGSAEVEEFRQFSPSEIDSVSQEDLRGHLLKSGLWPLILQRPLGKIARPDSSPVAVFINAMATAPLSAQPDVLVTGREAELAAGVKALARFCREEVYISVNASRPAVPGIAGLDPAKIHTFSGPHPSGCTGVHIRRIRPLKRGEIAWSIRVEHVADIGRFLLTGRYPPERIVALAGTEVKDPKYYRTRSGASLMSLTDGRLTDRDPVRCINGDVLTGSRTDISCHIGLNTSTVTVIPEGTAREFMGWGMPGFKRYSAFRTFASALLPRKNVILDTRLNGGVRPIINVGQWERVFPFDIHLSYLVRAIQAGDIQEAEDLGLLELVEEDVALCSFVDPSKIEVTDILRRGLDMYESENL